MSIALIVTEGFGNGTLVGSIADIVTSGFTIGEEVAIGSGIYYTMYLEGSSSGTYEPSLPLSSGDVKISIMNASGTFSALSNVDILPVNEPSGSLIYKGEFSEDEMALINARDKPMAEVLFIDSSGAGFKTASFSYDGDGSIYNRLLDVWRRLGLDPDNALYTDDDNNIIVGDSIITLTAVNDTDNTIQTRS